MGGGTRGVVAATVGAANEDRPGWRFQFFYPDSFCVSFGSNTCMIEVKGAGAKHGFSATFADADGH
ncbi:MAG: hypothetical protein V9G12_25555 [Microthrixaceae bacterium]